CPSYQRQVVINGELPEQYIQKNGEGGVLDVPLLEVPVVDLTSLTSQEELQKLRSALSSLGCFQAINHGITHSFLEEVREIAKEFFALPMEEKRKYSREVDGIDGYGNDIILSEQQRLDWSDRLYLTLNPEDQRRLKYWPETPQAFRDIFYTIILSRWK
ncbi:S-norcoclaurine synthase 1-like, partial [Carya illinoinensis]|uniref:S-norcoclaurine synthase 1-like n=1 Tax=Carya illinoinensis TaxID=32201 RepID=UPI001C720D95